MKIQDALDYCIRNGATHVIRTESSLCAFRPAITIPNYHAWVSFERDGRKMVTDGKWNLIEKIPESAEEI